MDKRRTADDTSVFFTRGKYVIELIVNANTVCVCNLKYIFHSNRCNKNTNNNNRQLWYHPPLE